MNRSQVGSLAIGVLGIAVAIVVVGAIRHGAAPRPANEQAANPPAAAPAAPAKPGKAKPATEGNSAPAKPEAQTNAQSTAPAAGAKTAPNDAASPAQPTTAQAKPDAATEKDASGKPAFDVLRVEPDGSTVIAGRAAPGAHIDVMNRDKSVASTDADTNGEFVAIIDPPLPPGDYELSLKATTKDKPAVRSDEVATVSVPKDKGGDVLALVSKPGEASRILSAPKSGPANAASASATTPGTPPTANQAPAAAATKNAAAAPSARPPAETASLSSDAASPTQDRPAADAGRDHVRVDAVEIEGDQLYVAGSATAGDKVRVYADDTFVGEDSSVRKGRFVVEDKIHLDPGGHAIRADLIDPKTGKVVVRATVPFTRPEGDQYSAIAPPVPDTGNAGQPAGQSQGQPAGQPGQPAESAAPSASAPATGSADVGKGGDEPKTVMQPALTNSDDFVIIRRGDTLWQIARRTYGRGIRYTTIYLANSSQISNPDLILPGQIFDVPSKSSPDAEKMHRKLMEERRKG